MERVTEVAIVPGSFDPITYGHIDIIERAAYIFDKVVVGVAVNPEKKPLFTLEERVKFITDVFESSSKIEVKSYNKLLTDFALENNAKIIIRGLRAVSDFEREFQIAQFIKKLNPTLEVMFLMSSPEYMYLSSSAVKEIAEFGGCLKGLVPNNVEKALMKIYQEGRR
ncbi:MAG: pantetheine-phosphate adenylyltransferase [Actinobacteria bacterium]|nr:pantetheine-phosphate adenylyltransferase [Actinomycetota bacterium]